MDNSTQMALDLQCPACKSPAASNPSGPTVTNQFLHTAPAGVILARYTNEGGVQDPLDILPALTEEAYLAENPSARRARAMLTMCAEGDIEDIVDVLRAAREESSQQEKSDMDLLCYQDELSDMKSPLHVAIDNSQEEVVWLLLWLGSHLSTDIFPVPARDAAGAMGLERPPGGMASTDIRTLKDGQGRTAKDLLRGSDEAWSHSIRSIGALGA